MITLSNICVFSVIYTMYSAITNTYIQQGSIDSAKKTVKTKFNVKLSFHQRILIFYFKSRFPQKF